MRLTRWFRLIGLVFLLAPLIRVSAQTAEAEFAAHKQKLTALESKFDTFREVS